MSDPSQPNDNQEAGGERAHTWNFEKFSEPRTMPAHWDLSEMVASSNQAGEGVSEPGVQSDPAPAQPFDPEAVDAVSPEWHRNPFPEPRTYPTHWDLYS
jgi:hypothetical protein